MFTCGFVRSNFSFAIRDSRRDPYRADTVEMVEPTTGIEPVTPSLPRTCSTTEPRGLLPPDELWSGKRDSNPRPSAWKADALATELLPPVIVIIAVAALCTARGGERRIRTSEGVRRQIYSLL